MSRTRAVLTALLLTSTLTQAGCSDDPEPQFAPSESPSSATSSATSDPDRDAQQAVVRDFFEAVSLSLSSGDTTSFIAKSSQQCRGCKVLARNLDRAYKDGGQIEGGSWQVGAIQYGGVESLGPVWEVDVRSAQEKWLDSEGDVVQIVDPAVQHFGVALANEDGTWVVRELRVTLS